MGFIAIATPSDDGKGKPDIVQNDGWFPDISVSALRDGERLDGTVTDTRLANAIVNAVLSVNQTLAPWQQEQMQRGHKRLTDIPTSRMNGESRLLALYRRAIHSTVKADLTERYRNFDTIGDPKTAETADMDTFDARRNAHWAIADLLHRPHMTVELI